MAAALGLFQGVTLGRSLSGSPCRSVRAHRATGSPAQCTHDLYPDRPQPGVLFFAASVRSLSRHVRAMTRIVRCAREFAPPCARTRRSGWHASLERAEAAELYIATIPRSSLRPQVLMGDCLCHFRFPGTTFRQFAITPHRGMTMEIRQ